MTEASEIGLIGLGTMGSNLALNIADAGYRLSVYNRTAEKTQAFHAETGALAERIRPAASVSDFVRSLASPRRILLMVPAGAATAQQIEALLPHLSEGDILIDGGNSDWRATSERAEKLARIGIRYVGLGVSGGAEGARFGPSLMAGGDQDAYHEIEPILTAVAACFGTEPCVVYWGTVMRQYFALVMLPS